jgi:hypothetical protein
MLTLNSAMTGASQYALLGRKADVKATIATAIAIGAALSGNEKLSPKDARAKVYEFLMDSGADKSTAARYRDAGAKLYQALTRKVPTAFNLAVNAADIGAAVTGLESTLSKHAPEAVKSRADMLEWCNAVMGIRKIEREEKSLKEKVQALFEKAMPSQAEFGDVAKFLVSYLGKTELANLEGHITQARAAIAAHEAKAEADAEFDTTAAADYVETSDPMLGLKVA